MKQIYIINLIDNCLQQPFVAMALPDFPKMENRAPEIYLSLPLTVKLVATDDNLRHVMSDLKPCYREKNKKRE